MQRVNDIAALKKVIKESHGLDATHLFFVRITENVGGKVVWDGSVEVFLVKGNSEVDRCFAWQYTGTNNEIRYVAILGKTPLDTPLKAVRTFLANETKAGE
jgi:hypothetical protein